MANREMSTSETINYLLEEMASIDDEVINDVLKASFKDDELLSDLDVDALYFLLNDLSTNLSYTSFDLDEVDEDY
jgi:hypothetical protein